MANNKKPDSSCLNKKIYFLGSCHGKVQRWEDWLWDGLIPRLSDVIQDRVSLCLPAVLPWWCQVHSVAAWAGPGLARSRQLVGLQTSLTTFRGRECCLRMPGKNPEIRLIR